VKSQELCMYLERLRSARNLSQESFTNNVVSLRQYRRYLNGESEIPFQVVDMLTEKLGVQTINLLREIEAARIEEQKDVDNFYNDVVNYANSDIHSKIVQWEKKEFVDPQNKLFYEYSLNLFKVFSQKMTKEDAITRNKTLIDYPKILKRSILTSVEMLVLSSIMDPIENEKESRNISEKLRAYLLDNSSMMTTGSTMAFNLMLHRLAVYSGKNKNYPDVIKYCQLGIESNTSQRLYHLMDYFHYFSALAYFRMGDFANYHEHLVKCFHILSFEGNAKKIEKFTKFINDDFNIHFQDFVINYYASKKETEESDS
jgi:transcriptional regulator with XRE-family HTH domain